MMKDRFPWYELVNDVTVLQGDLLSSCPIFIPSPESLTTKEGQFEVKEYDVIVLSQSCDIVAKKIDFVLVCPVWSLRDLELKNDFLKNPKGKEALRQGNVLGYHLLNICEIADFKRDFMAVDFRSTYSVPLSLIADIAATQSKRLRLLPPYREHLSQAFARFFMRVGLPIDIPSFK